MLWNRQKVFNQLKMSHAERLVHRQYSSIQKAYKKNKNIIHVPQTASARYLRIKNGKWYHLRGLRILFKKMGIEYNIFNELDIQGLLFLHMKTDKKNRNSARFIHTIDADQKFLSTGLIYALEIYSLKNDI